MKCRIAKDLNVFKSVANLISERRKLWARVTFYMQLIVLAHNIMESTPDEF